MVTAKTQCNLTNARKYFEEHLSIGDYYDEGQRVSGEWFGQQWYVTISRGRRGVRIFTPDKDQLRENVARSGNRPLAVDFAADFRRQDGVLLWDKLRGYLRRFGEHAAETLCQLEKSHRQHCNQNQEQTKKHEHQVI